MKNQADNLFVKGEYDKFMQMYATMKDQDLVTKEEYDRAVTMFIESPVKSIDLNETKRVTLYKPITSETRGKTFKRVEAMSDSEKKIYNENLTNIKRFNDPKIREPTGQNIISVLESRNILISRGLISAGNRTLNKLDEVISDLLNDPNVIDNIRDIQREAIGDLQDNYNEILEEKPLKKYYQSVRELDEQLIRAEAKLGLIVSNGNSSEAIDEAVENNHSEQNAVLTNVEEVTDEPPALVEEPSSNIDNLFRTRNIDATTMTLTEPKEDKLESIENPLPMSLNDNLVVSSLEDVDSYGMDETKTRVLSSYSGLNLQNLINIREMVAKEGMGDLEKQKLFMEELTEQIELLSGGMKDSLFNANDLMTAKDNNIAPDIDYDAEGNPLTGLQRGRNAQHLVNVDLDGIDNFFNNANENPSEADKIAQGAEYVGTNVFRNTYGVNPVVSGVQPAGDIASNINNRINLGEDWFSRSGKREKGFITEEHPTISSRFENMNAVTLNKDFQGLGKWNPYIGNRQDYMLGRYKDNIGAPAFSDLEGQRIRQEKRNAMMAQQKQMGSAPLQMQGVLPQNKGVAPPSVGALRQQQIPYQTPNRTLRGDAVNLIRLANKTALELANEFAPQ